MSNYLLHCPCGQDISIDPSQAGQTVTCACGKTQTAPSMRAMRELPVDASKQEARAPDEKHWGSAAGTAFVSGTVLCVFALCVAGWAMLGRAHNDAPPPPEPQLVDEFVNQIEQRTPSELFDLWDETLEQGLPDREESPYVQAATQRAFYNRLAIAGFSTAGFGLLIAIGAFLLRR